MGLQGDEVERADWTPHGYCLQAESRAGAAVGIPPVLHLGFHSRLGLSNSIALSADRDRASRAYTAVRVWPSVHRLATSGRKPQGIWRPVASRYIIRIDQITYSFRIIAHLLARSCISFPLDRYIRKTPNVLPMHVHTKCCDGSNTAVLCKYAACVDITYHCSELNAGSPG